MGRLPMTCTLHPCDAESFDSIPCHVCDKDGACLASIVIFSASYTCVWSCVHVLSYTKEWWLSISVCACVCTRENKLLLAYANHRCKIARAWPPWPPLLFRLKIITRDPKFLVRQRLQRWIRVEIFCNQLPVPQIPKVGPVDSTGRGKCSVSTAQLCITKRGICVILKSRYCRKNTYAQTKWLGHIPSQGPVSPIHRSTQV